VPPIRAGEEARAERVLLTELERPVSFRLYARAQLVFAPMLSVDCFEADRRARLVHALHGYAASLLEGGAQRWVTASERLQSGAHSLRVDAFGQTSGEDDVVGSALALKLLQKPERPLPVRKRVLVLLCLKVDGYRARSVLTVFELVADAGREVFEACLLEERRQRRRDPQLSLDSVAEFDCQQRVEAERAERLTRINGGFAHPQRRRYLCTQPAGDSLPTFHVANNNSFRDGGVVERTQGKHVQISAEETSVTQAALDLAARSLGQRACAQQRDCVRL